jgi:hypothetical protein
MVLDVLLALLLLGAVLLACSVPAVPQSRAMLTDAAPAGPAPTTAADDALRIVGSSADGAESWERRPAGTAGFPATAGR